MKKSFIDIFVELADEADKAEAKRVASLLQKNGIDSLERLIKTCDSVIAEIRGIGNRYMHIISVIKTREIYKSEQKISDYKKLKGKKCPKDFRYYLQKAGATYLESCNIEKIVKQNGVATVDEFLLVRPNCMDGWKGIGPKRLATLTEAQKLIAKSKRIKL